MTVYIDVLFAVNLIMNYLLLRASGKIAGRAPSRRRSLLAAALGAAYAAAVCLLPDLPLFWSLPLRIAAGAGMAAAAFGFRGYLRKTLLFFAVSGAFAGIFYGLSFVASDYAGLVRGQIYLNISLPVLIAGAAAIYGLLTLLLRPAMKAKAPAPVLRAEVFCAGKSAGFPVLVDTGCTLSDPMANREILVAGADALAPVLPRQVRDSLRAGKDPADIVVEHSALLPGARLVFYRDVSGRSDMLPAFIPDRILLNSEERDDILVAISASGLGGEDGVSAVLGSSSFS